MRKRLFLTTVVAAGLLAATTIRGNAMVVLPGGSNHFSCTSCHDEKPHKKERLNKHVAAVACQSCHIPSFAKENPTMLYWDWSSAGQDKRAPLDQYGKETYGGNLTATSTWYNGEAGACEPGDMIDAVMVTRLNRPEGDVKDENARIYPFKVHLGKQNYDQKNVYVIKPRLWPIGQDDCVANWKNFDWSEAAGMEYSDDFAPTVMSWPVNHMVASAKDALTCSDCHGKRGRLNWQALGYAGDPMRTYRAALMK